jgi:hypothetical protein
MGNCEFGHFTWPDMQIEKQCTEESSSPGGQG